MSCTLRSIIIIHNGSESLKDLHALLSKQLLAFIGPELNEETTVPLTDLKEFDAVLLMAGDVFPKLSDDFVQNLTSFVKGRWILNCYAIS